jgi:hypothetical protein
MKTSKNSTQLTFLSPIFGPEDFLAKTSRWRAWAREQGLEESALDSFMTLLASLEKHAPELYCSKTLQVSLAHTVEEIAIFQNAMAVCVNGDTRQNLDEHRQLEKVMDMQLALFSCEFIFATASAGSKCDVHCQEF